MSQAIFPPLENWEPTRQTLHWYCRAVTAIPRAHAQRHPKWWHASLRVVPEGLVTEKVAVPDGRTLWMKIDLQHHVVVAYVGSGIRSEIELQLSMKEGLTSSQLAERLISVAADLGLRGPYTTKKYENDDPREYDPLAAERFFTALVNADRLFKKHRASLDGEVSPVNFWPHNFDLSVEWFGTRIVILEGVEHPSQLNLGFYPGDPESGPYFYSNPWPFEAERLLDKLLPAGARWHTEGWKGTILPYEELLDESEAEDRLLAYAKRVFEICAPTLFAE